MSPRAQVLDGLRRWIESVQALSLALDEAIAAERSLAESEERRQTLTAEIDHLTRQAEAARDRLACLEAETNRERERLLAPALAERDQVLADIAHARAGLEADRQAFEAERGRRRGILARIEEDTQTAERDQQARLGGLKKANARAIEALQAEIEVLRAERAEAEVLLATVRSDYRNVLEAAAKLAGR